MPGGSVQYLVLNSFGYMDRVVAQGRQQLWDTISGKKLEYWASVEDVHVTYPFRRKSNSAGVSPSATMVGRSGSVSDILGTMPSLSNNSAYRRVSFSP